MNPAEIFLRPVFCWLEEAVSALNDRNYRPETRMVHAGSLRSQFGEMSEALFLTQGYVYETALTAEKRASHSSAVG